MATTTITFKLSPDEARTLRQRARRMGVTLSEYLRRQLLSPKPNDEIRQQRCSYTGATIFAPAPHLPPLSTESVREALSDFP